MPRIKNKLRIVLLIMLIGFIFGLYQRYPRPSEDDPPYKQWVRDRIYETALNDQIAKRFIENPELIEAVELFLVDPGKPYFTWAGHIFVRFVQRVGGESSVDASGQTYDLVREDLTISVLPNITDFPVNDFKAVFGGYSVQVVLKTLFDQWGHYVRDQNRGMIRLRIHSSENQRKLLIEEVKRWIQRPSEIEKYTYFDNNCIGAVRRMFKKAGIPFPDGFNVVPVNLIEHYKTQWPDAFTQKSQTSLLIKETDFN